MHLSKLDDEDKTCSKEWLKQFLSNMRSKNDIKFAYGGYKIQGNREIIKLMMTLILQKNTQIDDANCAWDSATNLDRLII